jgi:hypothetical protein
VNVPFSESIPVNVEESDIVTVIALNSVPELAVSGCVPEEGVMVTATGTGGGAAAKPPDAGSRPIERASALAMLATRTTKAVRCQSFFMTARR